LVIEVDLPLPTVAVPLGADTLGPVVELGEEVALTPKRVEQFEGAIGEQGLPMYINTSRRRVFSR